MTVPSLLVTIRSAQSSFKDVNVEVEENWSVENLKSHLQINYPSNPDAKKQRLIYAGQLMKDKEQLSTYFKRQTSDHFPIIHLVFTPSVDQQIPYTEGVRHRRPQQTTPAVPVQENLPQQEPYVSIDAQAGQQIPFGNMSYFGAPMQDPGWQQSQMMYNAYMMQYMQYLQQLYGPAYSPWAMGGQMTTMMPPATSYAGQPAVPATGDLQGNVQAPGIPAQPQAPGQGQQAMNAQGGVAVDDEDDVRNRDWLDWMYMGCRAVLLFTILYFYSSMERFTFVMLCCLIIYGYQAGWFGRRGRNNVQINEPANQPPRAPNADGNAPPNEPTPPTTDDPANQANQEPQTAWVVFWSTCWTFISSFFSSLVPQRPPPMNLN